MEHGTLSLQIEEILKAKGISKNQICKALDIPHSNFNRYCRDEFQRMDVNLICKLLYYLDGDISVFFALKSFEELLYAYNEL